MFTLDQVVPWGRSFDEYARMFALGDDDLRGRILGCGDGPASFNAEATRRGIRVTSCDPIYQFTADQLRSRIDETRNEVIEQTRRHVHEFVWTSIPSLEALERTRMAAMIDFLSDVTTGKVEGRYVDASLPMLPFADGTFDLALCSHLLFLYSTQLGETLHRAAARELCRVADEVRLFPLLALGGQPSPFVDLVVADAHAAGLAVSIEPVPYEFQRGANQMLRLGRTGRLPQPRRR